MSNVLITGICGFVGSHLAEYLLKNTDWKIYGLMRWDESLDNLENLTDEINNGSRIQLIQGDLEDYDSLIQLVRLSNPEYVFHLAAQSYVQASFKYPTKTYTTNIVGTQNLFDVLRRERKDAIIHNCSSSEVYGRVPAGYGPIAEDCPFAPASPYSISKVAQDMIGKLYADSYDMQIMTTRMFTHTGPRRGDVFFESTVAKQIAMIEADMIEPVIKVGNLDSIRTIADVRDAVRAYHMLLTMNPVRGAAYNIGGTHTCSIRDILDFMNPGFKVEVDPARLRPMDANFQIPNCKKFKRHTGWKPEISFEKTLLDLLNYWRDKVEKHPVLQR